MRLTTIALFALMLALPLFAQTNDDGVLPAGHHVCGGSCLHVTDIKMEHQPGLVIGHIERGDGALTILTSLEPGTTAILYSLDNDGGLDLPVAFLSADWQGSISFGGADGGSTIPAMDADGGWGLPWALDVIDTNSPDGYTRLATGMMSNDPIGGLPTYAQGNNDPVGDLPTFGSAAVGADGDGGVQPFATGKCNKSKCRLTIKYNDGTDDLCIELAKDDDYHIPWSTNVAIIICSCN